MSGGGGVVLHHEDIVVSPFSSEFGLHRLWLFNGQ